MIEEVEYGDVINVSRACGASSIAGEKFVGRSQTSVFAGCRHGLSKVESIYLISFLYALFLSPAVAKTFGKIAAGALPVAAISAPALALDSVVEALPSNTVALEVQFGAYMAVALGTLLPCLFLINLFIQTESRKAGKAGGLDSE